MNTTFKIKKHLFDLENFLQKTIDGVCFVVNIEDDEKENYIKNTWNGIYLINNKNKLNLLTGKTIDSDLIWKFYGGEIELYTLFAYCDIECLVRCINKKKYIDYCFEAFVSDFKFENEDEAVSELKYRNYLKDNSNEVLNTYLYEDDTLGYRIRIDDDEIVFTLSNMHCSSFLYDEYYCDESVIGIMEEYLNTFIDSQEK